MKKLTFIFVLGFYFSYSQSANDSMNNGINGKNDTIKYYNPVNIVIPYFKIKNQRIFKINNRFSIKEYYDSGELKSDYSVIVEIDKFVEIMAAKVTNDTTPAVKEFYSFITIKDGYYREYYLNGKLKEKGTYWRSYKIGKWYTYNAEGGLIKRVRYAKKDRIQ